MGDTELNPIWVLGGDGRYPWAVKKLRRGGISVRTWGVIGMANDTERLEAALEGAETVLLPMKAFSGDLLTIGKDSVETALLPWLLARDARLIYGMIPPETEAWLEGNGVRCSSFLELESYQMANAAVTAEGAVYLALRELDRTLLGAKALVIGWGRIGRFLAEKLRALGASVTVSARKGGDRSEILGHGLIPEETGVYRLGLKDYDVVFNTVPAPVLSGEQAEELREDCLLIELASAPGGFSEAVRDKRAVVMGQGLPGITAPRTAGEHLSNAVLSCLTGEGRTLE